MIEKGLFGRAVSSCLQAETKRALSETYSKVAARAEELAEYKQRSQVQTKSGVFSQHVANSLGGHIISNKGLTQASPQDKAQMVAAILLVQTHV